MLSFNHVTEDRKLEIVSIARKQIEKKVSIEFTKEIENFGQSKCGLSTYCIKLTHHLGALKSMLKRIGFMFLMSKVLSYDLIEKISK